MPLPSLARGSLAASKEMKPIYMKQKLKYTLFLTIIAPLLFSPALMAGGGRKTDTSGQTTRERLTAIAQQQESQHPNIITSS